MNGMLATAEEIQQKQEKFRDMTKRDLMNIVRKDIGNYESGALYFVRKLRNWAIMCDEKKEAFDDGPLRVEPRMVPHVKEFVDQSILILEETLQLISDIYRILPDESVHTARALVQSPSQELIRLKFAL